MSLFVACQCGRAFEVPDDHPGGSATCPDCGREVAVAPPAPAGEDSAPESIRVEVETVDAERAGDTPPRDPRVRYVDLRATGTSCLVVIALIVATAIAIPQFGLALVGGILGCCALPLLVLGGAVWWRVRQFKKALDAHATGGDGSPPG